LTAAVNAAAEGEKKTCSDRHFTCLSVRREERNERKESAALEGTRKGKKACP